jgi:hypothetical protein
MSGSFVQMWRTKMTTQPRAGQDKKAEFALVQALKKARADVEKHILVGEGAAPVPREVYYAAQEIIEAIDAVLEKLTMDVNDDVDVAVEDLGR